MPVVIVPSYAVLSDLVLTPYPNSKLRARILLRQPAASRHFDLLNQPSWLWHTQ
jgi:hypothetical protein